VNPALQRSSAVEGASISDRSGAVSRRPTAAVQGLTKAEAHRRLSQRGGAATISASRSYASIIRANVLTIFNLILASFGVVTLVFGDWRDALFLGILVANTGIGITQEVLAKRALNRLALLVAPHAVVLRDGSRRGVPASPPQRRRSAVPADTRREKHHAAPVARWQHIGPRPSGLGLTCGEHPCVQSACVTGAGDRDSPATW
jgi:hypothetical protein